MLKVTTGVSCKVILKIPSRLAGGPLMSLRQRKMSHTKKR